MILTVAGIVYITACASSPVNPAAVSNTPLPASNAVQPATQLPVDDASRITLAEAKKNYDAGIAVIVDVRPEAGYKEEHIKGSLNITIDTLAANLSKLPKGKKIIAYCS